MDCVDDTSYKAEEGGGVVKGWVVERWLSFWRKKRMPMPTIPLYLSSASSSKSNNRPPPPPPKNPSHHLSASSHLSPTTPNSHGSSSGHSNEHLDRNRSPVRRRRGEELNDSLSTTSEELDSDESAGTRLQHVDTTTSAPPFPNGSGSEAGVREAKVRNLPPRDRGSGNGRSAVTLERSGNTLGIMSGVAIHWGS
ncbi:hypothetical protein BT69DRAFT_1394138 [Atractiella rhizophila]|nr:hypothetical protein BT69DRAFT_1394138 [Atractiella rhizophila]